MHSGNPPESFGPKYKPIKVVGRGTWGVVTQCKGESGEIVALKTFEGADKNELVRKVVVREAKVLKQVDHPNIVKLIEVFRTKSNLYLVFEFVDFTLLDCIQRHRYGVPYVQLTTLLTQLAKAIDFLHSKNIIHRDLKPENTLVTKDGTVKLADFGFARSVPKLEGAWTAYVSTRWYRAPEMLLGSEYGAAADIWAFGCILAEMATGRPLFPGSSDLDQLHQIMCTVGICQGQKDVIKGHTGLSRLTTGFPDEPLVSLAKRLPNVEANVVAVVQACLRPDPKDRPSSSELLQLEFFQPRKDAPSKATSLSRPSTVPVNAMRPSRNVSGSDCEESMFAPAPAMTSLGEPGLAATARRAGQGNNPMHGGKKPILSVRPSEARHSPLSSSLRDVEPDAAGARYIPTPPKTPPWQQYSNGTHYGSPVQYSPYMAANAQYQAGQYPQAWGAAPMTPVHMATGPLPPGHVQRRASQYGFVNGSPQPAFARISDQGGLAHRWSTPEPGPRVSEPGLLIAAGAPAKLDLKPGFKLDLKPHSPLMQSSSVRSQDHSGDETAVPEAGPRQMCSHLRSSMNARSTELSVDVHKLRISMNGSLSTATTVGSPPTHHEAHKHEESLFAQRKLEQSASIKKLELRLPSLF